MFLLPKFARFFPILSVLPIAWIASAMGQSTLTYNFETAGQFTANFRRISAIGAGTAAQTTVSSNTFFRVVANTTTASTNAAYLFDQTPTDFALATQSTFDTSAPVTVSYDIRAVTTDSVVSIIFADPSDLSNNVSAVLNIKTGNDNLRFFKDGTLSSTNAALGTQVGSTTTVATSAEPGAAPVFTNLSVTLSRSGSTPTLTITVAGASPVTYTFYKGNMNWARTAVLFRIDDAGDASGTPVDLDNLIINSAAAPVSPVGPNTSPILPPQANRTLAADRLLIVANPADDFDSPEQTLTYAFTEAPAGASIGNDGTIQWRPTAAQVSATPYVFATQVTDDGSPALTASNTFSVTVTAAQSLGAYTQDLDFSTPGQFASLFRSVNNVGGGKSGQVGTSLVLDANSSGGNTSNIFLFDATPLNESAATQTAFPTTSPITINFSIRANLHDSVAGIVFADSRNATNNVSALFNIRNDADLLRFYRDGDITATTLSSGTQVGSNVNLVTVAEPGYPEYVPVTVILSVSGTTPTISVKVGDATPVLSAFIAGDLNWTTSLVLLRLTDPSVSNNTPIEIKNLVISGGTPIAAVPPTYAPAPGADGNLLTVNPGFEATSSLTPSGAYHAPYTLPGWNGYNDSYGVTHSIGNGTVGAGTTTAGTRKLVQRQGGYVLTDAASRVQATPGLNYELRQDQRVTRRTYPSEKLGSIRYLEFFDSAGVRIKQVWGINNDYKVQFQGTLNTWETFTLRAIAPANTASVGVRLENPSGRFVSSSANYVDDRDVELDNIQVKVIPNAVDRLSYRRLPRLVEPGKTATLKISHVALAARTLRVALLDASGVERATTSASVPEGRFRANPISLTIPNDLANGTYSWRLQLLTTAAPSPAVATLNVPGVVVDESVANPNLNDTDFRADHPRIQYMGRIEELPSGSRWLHWHGSETRVRFSGTSLTMTGAVSDNSFGGYDAWNFFVVIDENFAAPLSIAAPLNGSAFTRTLVSGLSNGVHTARIFKEAESNLRLRLDSLRTDVGSGLLLPEPPSPRRLETFGDSVTSGSSAASSGLLGYADLLGRELDARMHIISKGGTGVAASFSGQALLGAYYDNLAFPNVFNGANTAPGSPWDFSRYTPDVALIAIGHNDQFNGGGGSNFTNKYAEFKGQLRTAYPGVGILSLNTLISNNFGHFDGATAPLTAGDPSHRFAYQPNTWNDSNTAHPPTNGHAAMVYGDELRYSLADIVEDMTGWGVDALLTGYEQWAATEFTQAERNAGVHAPSYDVNGDGVSNLMKYALGIPSHASAAGALPEAAVNGSNQLTLSFMRARSDVTYVIETSDNLETWVPSTVNPGSVGSLVMFTDESAPQNTSKRFARLVVY